jgi:molybdopterin converting factor small subunit
MTHPTETVGFRLLAGLEPRAREPRAAWEPGLAEAATVGAVTAVPGLEPGATGLILVNRVHGGPGRAPAPGDEVALLPPLGGG